MRWLAAVLLLASCAATPRTTVVHAGPGPRPVFVSASSSTTTSTTTAPPPPVDSLAKVFDAIALCESGGNWSDTRAGFEGGVHFLHDTWVKAGGRRFAEHAWQATRAQQIEIAEAWLMKTSWAQWPACSRKLGLR